jgi:tRNA threonylcarbamoyladenosine biosynthesis protein TsaB
MAYQVSQYLPEETLACPMIDARRMEVYCSMWNGRSRIYNTEAKIIDQQSFSELLDEKRIAFCGNGSDKLKGTITHPNALFVKGIFPDARYVGYLAKEKFKEEAFEDLAYFEPFYLKAYKAGKPKKQSFC